MVYPNPQTIQTDTRRLYPVAICDASGDQIATLPVIVSNASPIQVSVANASLPVTVASTEARPLLVAALDSGHYELHEGDSFVASYLVNSLASGSSHDHRIVTPNTADWGHHVLEVISTGEAEIYIYEGATLSGGTALAAVNRNRNSTNTAGISLWHTPTVTATGTEIWLGLVGSGIKAGGGERALTEFILKQNTTYLMRVTSRATGNKIVIRHDWYEHTFGDD